MPPKSCPCACKPVRRARKSRKPRAPRVRQTLPPQGFLQPMITQVPVQAPILQAPVKAIAEKITMGTQTEAPKRVSIGIEAKPQTSSVGIEAKPKSVSVGTEVKPKSVSISVGTEPRRTSEMGVGTEPKQTSEMGIQAGVRKAVREMGTSMPVIPPSRPINERMNIPYTATTGRYFTSPLGKIKEEGKIGRPSKEETEAKIIAKVAKMEAEAPKPVAPPKPVEPAPKEKKYYVGTKQMSKKEKEAQQKTEEEIKSGKQAQISKMFGKK